MLFEGLEILNEMHDNFYSFLFYQNRFIWHFILKNYAMGLNDYLPYDTKIKICERLAGMHMIRRSIATVICP